MEVIQEIIGCQKHGGDFERYVKLWQHLHNDDCIVIEEYVSSLLQARNREIIEKIEKMKMYCHESNFQRGCMKCVDNHRINIILSDIITTLTGEDNEI